jgi:diketogulonate reductase-like aldo/keto reductase
VFFNLQVTLTPFNRNDSDLIDPLSLSLSALIIATSFAASLYCSHPVYKWQLKMQSNTYSTATIQQVEIDEGFYLPQIGLAAFQLDSGDKTVQRFVEYLLAGGRMIEIAELFTNYHFLPKALEKCHLKREDVFISLKIWPQGQTPEALLGRIEGFFSRNRLDYVDILMVHAPIDIDNRFEQWRSLEIVKKRQWARALGVTNLSLNQLMTVVKNAEILPTVFQMEVSPFHQQKDIQEYCYAGQIVIINNEPICKGMRDRHPYLIQISQELNLSSEQILFRWSIAKGFVTLIPASSSTLGFDPKIMIGSLPEEVIVMLDSFDEELMTCWAPIVEEDS